VQWVPVPQLKNHSILVDGAHNTGGAQQLRKFIDRHLSAHASIHKVIFLFGASSSKDLRGILRLLLRDGDEVLALPFTTPERMPWVHCYRVSDIVALIGSLNPQVSCLGFDSFDSAFTYLNSRIRFSEEGQKEETECKLNAHEILIVLCGSLYLLADFYRSLGAAAKPYLWEDYDSGLR
jgi:folylpolyglutamate synthase/dihydropteroate synthase